MKRLHQFILLASFPLLCWLAMMAVHELGHAVAGWSTGGVVNKVVIHPLAISRTDVSPNPHPLIVVWAGPIVGVSLPLALWLIFLVARIPGVYLPRFFAGFCLITNGAYIAIGSLQRIGDAGEMLRCGSPIWLLWIFGGLAIPAGLLLWNGLGPHFGLGESKRHVDKWAAYVSLALLIVAITAMVIFSPRQ